MRKQKEKIRMTKTEAWRTWTLLSWNLDLHGGAADCLVLVSLR